MRLIYIWIKIHLLIWRKKLIIILGLFTGVGFIDTFHILLKLKGRKIKNSVSKRKIKIENFQVYRDGMAENIAELDENSNGQFFAKIGRKNQTITGEHKYILKYKVRGSIRYFDNFDEVYWNAMGTGWTIPIKKAKINLYFDQWEFKDKSCYQGRLKSTEKCDIQGNTFYSTRVLNSGEGLTVVASFNKGLVKKEIFWDENVLKIWWKEILAFLATLISGIGYWIYSYKNKYNPHKPIIPIYEPYQNYHPTLTGYLIDGKLDGRDLTAGIISLAQKGYIKIKRTTEKVLFFDVDNYEFILLKETDENTDKLDRFLIEFLFSNKTFDDIINLISSKEKEDKWDKERLDKSVKLSDLKMVTHQLYAQKKEIDKFLEKYSEISSFIEKNSFVRIFVRIIIFMSPIAALLVSLFKNFNFVFFVSALIFLSFLLMAFLAKRKTRKGWEVENNLKGFKKFLSYTEKERIEIINSPAQNPEEFLKYLAYAIAFKVDDKWQKQFQNITILQPDWYVGSGPFVAGNFVSDISNFSDAINSVTTAAYSSGGGGFSGGGGGGGGGGSW